MDGPGWARDSASWGRGWGPLSEAVCPARWPTIAWLRLRQGRVVAAAGDPGVGSTIDAPSSFPPTPPPACPSRLPLASLSSSTILLDRHFPSDSYPLFCGAPQRTLCLPTSSPGGQSSPSPLQRPEPAPPQRRRRAPSLPHLTPGSLTTPAPARSGADSPAPARRGGAECAAAAAEAAGGGK